MKEINLSHNRENDALGGYDPYSSSKAAAEIAINSWRSSFCGIGKNKVEHFYIPALASFPKLIKAVTSFLGEILKLEKIILNN